MTTTYADIRNEIDTAVKAGGVELAEGIDVDAITTEFIDRYGLISIDAKDEDGDAVVDHDEFWTMVRRHDVTQAVEVTTSVRNASGAWEIIDRERAEDVLPGGMSLDDVEVSAADLGGSVGQAVKVALVDAEGHEIRTAEVAAK